VASFDRADRNRDGRITVSEWDDTRQAFRTADANRDNVLSREEYNAAIRERLGTPSSIALYMEASDLAGFYSRLEAAGVRIVDPLAARPWGQDEFTVEDHEGNWLTFWMKVEHPE